MLDDRTAWFCIHIMQVKDYSMFKCKGFPWWCCDYCDLHRHALAYDIPVREVQDFEVLLEIGNSSI